MRVSVLSSALFLAASLFAATASPEVAGESTPASSSDLARICESARLTDIERREYRAMFKTAETESDRVSAFHTFYERINGSVGH